MKVYEVRNRITGETRMVTAESAQAACERLGWLIDDCFWYKKFKREPVEKPKE